MKIFKTEVFDVFNPEKVDKTFYNVFIYQFGMRQS